MWWSGDDDRTISVVSFGQTQCRTKIDYNSLSHCRHLLRMITTAACLYTSASTSEAFSLHCSTYRAAVLRKSFTIAMRLAECWAGRVALLCV